MNFVFLFCSERSGSNLITSMAGAHPNMCGPPPSHLFRLFGLNEASYTPIEQDRNWDAFVADLADATAYMIGEWESKFSADLLRDQCPERSVAAALEYLYRAECSSSQHIAFVKENYSYSIADFLNANWPDAKFVHQVRDPRDVAASWVRTAEAKGGVEEATETWLRDQQETIRVFEETDDTRKASWRYEDLISNPQHVMAKLCKLVGLSYDSAMLRFHSSERVKRNAERVPAWRNLSKPVLATNSGKYRAVLSTDDVRYIELCCGALMDKFGYQRETAAVGPDISDAEIAELRPSLSRGSASTPTSKEQAAIRSNRQQLIDRVIGRAKSL
ncbi:sulfotransferase [Parasphingopyxis sp. CP4]|uniref:sulfotransferase family protein n=1 Tax=Parasphingopyxis sp. CP4 TaxID=2724527 RepID=UPI0015A1A4A8|nr:sulfotransferase [Parasphingopyxis sp. CP4]QLC22266.1 sulfotransferase [Parasphingopyxis sp. CP4]